MGKPLQVRSPEEIKFRILNAVEVKDVMATLGRERAKKYEGHLQVIPQEDKIFGEIQKEAI